MPALPTVGGSVNTWGTELNQFLLVAHKADGSLKAVLNAKDYGAVGDDSNDDTAEIQAALAALPAVGGVVYLPAGTYKISGTLDLGLKKSLVGESYGATVLHYTGSSHAISIGDAAASSFPGVCTNRLTDLSIVGSGETTAGSIGVRVIKCLFPVIERTFVTQIELAYKFDGGTLWVASGSCLHIVASNVKNGILLTAASGGGVNDMKFLGGYVYGSGSNHAGAYGVKIVLGDTNHFYGTSVEGFSGTNGVGFWIESFWTGGQFLCGTRTETCTIGVLLDTAATCVTILNHSGSFITPIIDNGYANLIIGRSEIRHSMRYHPYAASFTPDAREAEIKYIDTLTGNITINNPTNPLNGQKMTLLFLQDGTGGRTITWGAKYKVGASWVPNTGPNKRNTITFVYYSPIDLWLQVGGATGL